jgi:hypothetical protein
MALAWKAGWVNSPQGFKSPILRANEGGGRCRPLRVLKTLVISSAVACPSGQRSAPRKRVWGQPHRGFKSHRHRHTFSWDLGGRPAGPDGSLRHRHKILWDLGGRPAGPDGSHRHRFAGFVRAVPPIICMRLDHLMADERSTPLTIREVRFSPRNVWKSRAGRPGTDRAGALRAISSRRWRRHSLRDLDGLVRSAGDGSAGGSAVPSDEAWPGNDHRDDLFSAFRGVLPTWLSAVCWSISSCSWQRRFPE